MKFELNYEVDLSKPVLTQALNQPLFYSDSTAHELRITLKDGGSSISFPATATGYAYFVHLNNHVTERDDLSFTSDRTCCYIEFPAVIYNTLGPISIVVQLVDGEDKTTILALAGEVRPSKSSHVIDMSGVVLPDLDELLEEIGDAGSVIQNLAKVVRVDQEQSFIDSEKVLGRSNIDAASQTDFSNLDAILGKGFTVSSYGPNMTRTINGVTYAKYGNVVTINGTKANSTFNHVSLTGNLVFVNGSNEETVINGTYSYAFTNESMLLRKDVVYKVRWELLSGSFTSGRSGYNQGPYFRVAYKFVNDPEDTTTHAGTIAYTPSHDAEFGVTKWTRYWKPGKDIYIGFYILSQYEDVWDNAVIRFTVEEACEEASSSPFGFYNQLMSSKDYGYGLMRASGKSIYVNGNHVFMSGSSNSSQNSTYAMANILGKLGYVSGAITANRMKSLFTNGYFKQFDRSPFISGSKLYFDLAIDKKIVAGNTTQWGFALATYNFETDTLTYLCYGYNLDGRYAVLRNSGIKTVSFEISAGLTEFEENLNLAIVIYAKADSHIYGNTLDLVWGFHQEPIPV